MSEANGYPRGGRSGIKHVTIEQTIAIGKRLDEVVDRVPTTDGSKKCVYKGSVSDQTLADEFGVSKSQIGNIRQQVYGLLWYPTKPSAPPAEYDVLFAKLVEAHDILNAKHNDLQDRFNRLVQNLAVNRIADVKHLEVKPNGTA